jgi:hypothetical protein
MKDENNENRLDLRVLKAKALHSPQSQPIALRHLLLNTFPLDVLSYFAPIEGRKDITNILLKI